MAKQLITTSELAGTRVLGGKNGKKRIGKVRSFVFHPKEKRCVGFIVKRPDLLWMFRRKDKFVSIDGYDFEDGRIVIRNVPEATDRAACKSLGVNWDDCVLWMGLPVMTQDGQDLGLVGSVTFNRLTGTVDSLETSLVSWTGCWSISTAPPDCSTISFTQNFLRCCYWLSLAWVQSCLLYTSRCV